MFARDLTRACDSVFEVFGSRARAVPAGTRTLDALALPITVPVADDGVIVLSTGHVEAPRHPAILTVARPHHTPGRHDYRALFLLEREGDEAILLPGVHEAGSGRGPASLATMSVAAAPRGLAMVGFGTDGAKTPIEMDDTTAGLLATALLITVGVKLTKAERGEQP